MINGEEREVIEELRKSRLGERRKVEKKAGLASSDGLEGFHSLNDVRLVWSLELVKLLPHPDRASISILEPLIGALLETEGQGDHRNHRIDH